MSVVSNVPSIITINGMVGVNTHNYVGQGGIHHRTVAAAIDERVSDDVIQISSPRISARFIESSPHLQ